MRTRGRQRLLAICTAAVLMLPVRAAATGVQQRDSLVIATGDSVIVRLVDVDMRAAVQSLARYLDRPVVFGVVGSNRVTIETPRPVAKADITRLLRGMLESQGYELFADSAAAMYRVRQKEAARPVPVAQPLAARPSGGGQASMQLYVIHMRHARAADAAATVNALYGKASALGEMSGRGATLRDQLEQSRVPPIALGDPAVIPSGAGAALSARPAVLADEITIVPDPRANSLLVRATPRDFELISAAIKEIDIRPLQVLISVTIAEVRKDRSLSFGIGASAPDRRIGRDGNSTIGGSLNGAPSVSDLVIDVLNIGGRDIDITLRAAAARGDVSILSRPIVIAANNEEAEINVGSQRPFVQVSRVLPTDNSARDQVVQYKDVGTRLFVRPTISPDGYVMLHVSQEVNQATNEASGLAGVDAPVISTRSVQTRLLIKDRQTVILGGLSDRQKDHSQGGVPVLSSIPWIGGLFGRVNRRATATELYLFITPHVIRDDAEAEGVTKPLQQKSEAKRP